MPQVSISLLMHINVLEGPCTFVLGIPEGVQLWHVRNWALVWVECHLVWEPLLEPGNHDVCCLVGLLSAAKVREVEAFGEQDLLPQCQAASWNNKRVGGGDLRLLASAFI